MNLLWFLPGILAFGSIQWQVILPQFNTGRVYMQRNTPWGAGALGPLCNATGHYSLTGDFFDYVCHENGFDGAVFYGSKDDYLSFMESRYHWKVSKYFKEIYENDVDLPDFTSGGARFNGTGWEFLDYQKLGGNCLHWSSSVFVHCKSEKQLYSDAVSWSEWTPVTYCDGCGSKQYNVRTCSNDNYEIQHVSKEHDFRISDA